MLINYSLIGKFLCQITGKANTIKRVVSTFFILTIVI